MQTTVSDKGITAAIQKKSLVFTVTTGRSGTGLLTELLHSLPGVNNFHEPEPNFQNVMRAAVADNKVARNFLLKEKLPAILNYTSSVYIETSHVFCKGFLEPLLEMGIVPNLIILHRAEREVAKSLYQLNTIPGRTEKALEFYLSPNDPGLALPLPNWERYTDYQLCFWYTLEIRKRQIRYAELVRNLGGKVVLIEFYDLVKGRGLFEIIEALDLPQINLYNRLKFKINSIQKVNTKQKQKKSFDIAPEKLFAMEKEIYYHTNFFNDL